MMNNFSSKALAIVGTLFCASISTHANAAPVQWSSGSGANGHYYDLVFLSSTWEAARDDAATMMFLGATGHLATITSAEENEFIRSTFDAAADAFLWIGARDDDVEGEWRWEVGPEAGTLFYNANLAIPEILYANWGPAEPNNDTPANFPEGEDVAAFNFGPITGSFTENGQWGDTKSFVVLSGYVIEYSDVAPIPIPAALPLFAGGLGLLGLLGWRRKRMAAA